MLGILSKLIDADKLGGWVRAAVAAIIAVVIGKWPGLQGILTPDFQAAIGVFVAGIIVGLWSQLTKSDTAKVTMAAKVESTTLIKTTDPAIAAVTPAEVVLDRK